jgi:hypothetical protein
MKINIENITFEMKRNWITMVLEHKYAPYKFAPFGSSQCVCVWGEGKVGGDRVSSHRTMNYKKCGGQNLQQEASIAGASNNKKKNLPFSQNRCHLHFIRT